MTSLSYTDVTEPDEALKKQLGRGLYHYNVQQIGRERELEIQSQEIATFALDAKGTVQGGAYGMLSWDWLYVDWLWCDEAVRGKGVGSKLLSRMEDHALEKGIQRFRLQTASFQALDFYLKNGYQVFGELDDYPIGHKTYFLKKIYQG